MTTLATTALATSGPASPRVALVTGAGRRIGRAIALALHADGWNLALHFRGGDEARELAAELEARRAQSAIALHADLAERGAPELLAAAAHARWQRLDALVNNASSFYPTALDELREDQFDDLIASNLRAPLFLAQACARRMGAGEHVGAIVNLLDIHARRPMRGYVAYCAAKAALWSVTESLAVELAPRIRVNGVAPGRMIWGGGDNLGEAQQQAEQQRIPLQRLGGGDEVARSVRFLLSDEAAYLNGAILPVDGGLRLV